MDKASKIKVLRDLLQIDTANGNELAVATYLQRLLQQYGLAAKVLEFAPNRANLVLDIGTGDPVLGITGHMDTVALGDTDQWTFPPLAAHVQGDRIYGRGAADMKSGLAAQVLALIELVSAGKLPGHVRWLATAGEEYGTPGANRLEKAGLARDLAALVVGEPTSGNIVYAHAGSFNYRVVSQGKAVHSSEPSQGKNALAALVDFCVAERTLFADVPADPYLGEVKHSVTIMHGGDQVNTIPDHAELYGNIRATKVFGNELVSQRLQKLVTQINAQRQAQLTLEVLHDWRPVGTDPESSLVQLALASSQAAYAAYPDHAEPMLTTINGATDASVFVKSNPDLPVVLLGPDDWNIAHQVDEYTSISSYLATIEAYKKLIVGYFN